MQTVGEETALTGAVPRKAVRQKAMPRKALRQKAMRQKAVLGVAVAALALLVSGCSKEVSADDLEATITEEAEGHGLTVSSVDCPEGLPAEVGATLTCDVQMSGPEGQFDRYELTVTEVDGDNVQYTLMPLLAEDTQ